MLLDQTKLYRMLELIEQLQYRIESDDFTKEDLFKIIVDLKSELYKERDRHDLISV